MAKREKFYDKEAKNEIEAVECKKCEDILFGRAQNDERTCSCGSISIYGYGSSFGVIGNEDNIIRFTLLIPQSRVDLYDDWNYGANQFGHLKPHEYTIFGIKGSGYKRHSETTERKRKRKNWNKNNHDIDFFKNRIIVKLKKKKSGENQQED
ncbi:MAG: hypothetical protein KDD45_11550 [Bdellovibrionales bacterium]|nr:hypothetical protein [Bdellovibrionales bacterium]